MPAASADRAGARSQEKEPSSTSLALPALDQKQAALIAQLESSREPWQTISPYEPEHAQLHAATRRADALRIRQSVPHEAHAEWTAPKNRPNPVDILVVANAGRQAPDHACACGLSAAGDIARTA